jgi:hypothetical protein
VVAWSWKHVLLGTTTTNRPVDDPRREKISHQKTFWRDSDRRCFRFWYITFRQERLFWGTHTRTLNEKSSHPAVTFSFSKVFSFYTNEAAAAAASGPPRC